MKKFLSRFWGKIHGAYPEFNKEPESYGGKRGAHIECEWTWTDHFAHNNYERGHLPQLCIIASGWKARLIALILWPKAPL